MDKDFNLDEEALADMETYQFPFGRSHGPTPPQTPIGEADLFVVGVYPSALHAAWFAPGGRRLCQALAVDIEPWSFWDGADAAQRVQEIAAGVPPEAGKLEPADPRWNGPSGRTLREMYLKPLGNPSCWITDLHDLYYISDGNARAIEKHYAHLAKRLDLPEARLPSRPPRVQPSPERLSTLEEEFLVSGAGWVLTLGNEPLPVLFPEGPRRLVLEGYGEPVMRMLFGRYEVTAIHFCHPRQAAGLGRSSVRWAETHAAWIEDVQRSGGLGGL